MAVFPAAAALFCGSRRSTVIKNIPPCWRVVLVLMVAPAISTGWSRSPFTGPNQLPMAWRRSAGLSAQASGSPGPRPPAVRVPDTVPLCVALVLHRPPAVVVHAHPSANHRGHKPGKEDEPRRRRVRRGGRPASRRATAAGEGRRETHHVASEEQRGDLPTGQVSSIRFAPRWPALRAS